MKFDSLVFGLFFVVFLAVYWRSRSVRRQNWWILAGSYLFYGWWDWRFLSLLALSTVVDFVAAQRIEDTPGHRRRFLLLSVAVNMGALGFFKYADFFAASLVDLLNSIGFQADPVVLGIVLPVGISFYTFQTMSYTIDVYRGHQAASRDFVAFACYVAFFPQLVAGPIERAGSLLPQFDAPRKLDQASLRAGITLLVFGLVKKIAIADNVAPYADSVFALPEERLTGPLAWSGALAFATQIYADFSGYSDVARGTAKLLGFELRVNFNRPYVSSSPSEFWQRWHISLSQWLRDYLYIPLGGNRWSVARTYRNLMLTMLLGGLWHGAAWNFVLWGGYHGLLLCGYRACGAEAALAKAGFVTRRLLAAPIFFALTLYGWMLFRARGFEQVASFSTAMLTRGGQWAHAGSLALTVVYFSLPLIVHHYLGRRRGGEKWQPLSPTAWRMVLVAAVLYGITHARANEQAFIYFQF